MSRWPHKLYEGSPFAGLCVGGPSDGNFLISQTPSCRVLVPPDCEAYPSFGSDPVKPVAVGTFVYHWVEGLRGPNAIDFFVPEGQTKEDALVAVFERYSKRVCP